MAEEENNTPEAPETEPEKDNTVAEETPAAEVATEAPQSGEDQKQEDAPAESEKAEAEGEGEVPGRHQEMGCLLYTSPSPRDS